MMKIVQVMSFIWLVMFSPALATNPGDGKIGEPISNIGILGPESPKLMISHGKELDYLFETGERIVLNVKSAKGGYLTIVNQSAGGDVIVLYPNRADQDNFIESDKNYVLFGNNGKLSLVMGKGLAQAQTVFFLTQKPLPLDLNTLPEDQPVLKFNEKDPRLTTLIEELKKASDQPGFSKKVVIFKSKDNASEPRLMGTTKGIPSKSPSDTPESISGSQGYKLDTK